jgi:hypothetical protein
MSVFAGGKAAIAAPLPDFALKVYGQIRQQTLQSESLLLDFYIT